MGVEPRDGSTGRTRLLGALEKMVQGHHNFCGAKGPVAEGAALEAKVQACLAWPAALHGVVGVVGGEERGQPARCGAACHRLPPPDGTAGRRRAADDSAAAS